MQPSGGKIRVLVVDGDPAMRQALALRLGQHPFVEVIGTAAGAQTALPKVASFRPDWVVVDVSADVAGGFGMLEVMQEARVASRRAVITASGGPEGAEQLLMARACGVAAVVPRRPRMSGPELVERLGADLLAPMLRAAGARGAAAPVVDGAAQREVRVVGVGVSTGGPVALNEVLPALPADFPAPVVVVQHMPAEFTRSLASSLDKVCALEVRELQGGEELAPGHVWIAPGGRNARVVRGAPRPVVQLTDDPPECSCRPSVDYLFRSLAATYGAAVLAVSLTGMGEDGWLGARAVHDAGGALLAQDEASAAVYGMPRGPIEAGIARAVPLSRMAAAIMEHVGVAR